jgi:hypothetical protein
MLSPKVFFKQPCKVAALTDMPDRSVSRREEALKHFHSYHDISRVVQVGVFLGRKRQWNVRLRHTATVKML